MAFKIGSSTSRPQKISKCISAFEDDDEGYTAVPRPPGQTAAGQSTAAEPGPSSSATEATKAAAAKWIDKGSAFAEQGNAAAALRCWDQALLVGLATVVPSYRKASSYWAAAHPMCSLRATCSSDVDYSTDEQKLFVFKGMWCWTACR
jgi:hypothetical protein